MLKTSPKKPIEAKETLQTTSEGVSSGYIFSEETVRSLQALGEILRRIDNRLKAEKAATIGAKRPDDANMKE